jgi:hypothetical protein
MISSLDNSGSSPVDIAVKNGNHELANFMNSQASNASNLLNFTTNTRVLDYLAYEHSTLVPRRNLDATFSSLPLEPEYDETTTSLEGVLTEIDIESYEDGQCEMCLLT